MARDILERIVAESFHQDYYHLAVESYQMCQQGTFDQWYLNRHIIDTIYYSYATIEAVVEYIHDLAHHNQIRIPAPDTWLTRHLQHIWRKLTLAQRIGMLAYTWVNVAFWESAEQYQLFEDLRKIRDGLTHLSLYKVSEKKEILERYSVSETIEGYKANILSHNVETQQFLRNHPKKAVAQFQNHPRQLTDHDAGQALEIMIWHLLQFERIFGFFRGELTTFVIVKSRKFITVDEILDLTGRQFEPIWPQCQPDKNSIEKEDNG